MNVGCTLAALRDAGIGRDVQGDASVMLTGVQHDSRAVQPGDLFAAVPGANVDGARFAGAAVDGGAAAVLANAPLSLPAGVPQLISDDVRLDLSKASEQVYGRPSTQLRVVGITGTNGKTTTAHLVESMLHALGRKPALLGTVAMRGPGFEDEAAHTTPEADDLARFMRRAVDAGATDLVMEVSSHGLTLRRVESVSFAVAAFTNLTQDHLDFHGTLDAYGEAKARLFTALGPAASVINIDDAFGAALATRAPNALRCSVDGSRGDLKVERWEMRRAGLRAQVAFDGKTAALRSPLVGAHNLENLLSAVGILLHLGVSFSDALAAAGRATAAPGRLERVTLASDDPGHARFSDVETFVDYAHTPDALRRVISALRPLTPGRLITVFGCGGDRDRTKRPKMGAAAAASHVCLVTSDNPRTEDPEAIIAEILPGVVSSGLALLDKTAWRAEGSRVTRGYAVIPERRDAIVAAMRIARPGDTVLIAGKGHEDYQIVGHTKLSFDDRLVAVEAMRSVAGGES